MNAKILVAAHKKYRMPEDDIYLPIHVGKEGKELELPYITDNTGENISKKNSSYCELTGIYWAWKNLDADYIGLAHYRRHFCFRKKGGKFESVLTSDEAEKLLKECDILVPNKRRYYIETNYSHYIHAHESEGLDVLCNIIKTEYPQYAKACDEVMNRTWAHMFNMFIMKKDKFDQYCEWLFEVLDKVEEQVDISGYDAVERRIFGYLSELMLDIWLIGTGYEYREVNVMFMEKQNWLVKGGRFVKRKFVGK